MNILRLIVLLFYSAFSEAQEPIKPVLGVAYDEEKAALGKLLFFEVRLSRDNAISCNSCHDLNKAGVDNRVKSVGVDGQLSHRNVPTVYNAVFNFLQLWDGAAESLEGQIERVVINPREMGMPSWEAVVEKIAAIDSYQQHFLQVYGQTVNKDNIIHALAEFERSLVSMNSPFDQYLLGDKQAISEKAKKGYELFKSYGCTSCHQGENVGGNMFQRAGTLGELEGHHDKEKSAEEVDMGRFHITGNEWDKRVFKVPGLRLVAKTAPYFHDGSVKTLGEAIERMVKLQLGKKIPKADKDAMIHFFDTLPGELPQG